MEKETARPQPIRAFIAVPIPDEIAVFLSKTRTRIQSPEMNFRWVEIKKIHLTLKFLGEIDLSTVPAITARMDAAAGSMTPFLLYASKVGVFPNVRRVRVLWVGLDGDIDALADIQTGLESGLASIGLRRDTRRFHPHLTIGRTRRRIDASTVGASIKSMKGAASDSWLVDQLGLYKSELKPAGAEYTRLHTSYLAV